MTTAELQALRRALDALRHSAVAARAAYGDCPEVRRVLNDVERLEIDVGELGSARRAREASGPPSGADAVVVPDTPLDESMWGDADDEGIGGYHGEKS